MPKSFIFLGMFLGSSIGGYLPLLYGTDILSIWPVIGSAVGGITGIWGTYQLLRRYY